MNTQPIEAEVMPPGGAVAKRSSQPLSVVNIEALLEKAIDAKSAVEVMERLQVMRREMRAEQAKEDFDRAMADFQSECPIIVKEKQGAKNAYRYAPLDVIVSQTRDLIRKHGFSFAITSKIEDGRVLAIVTITHASGHSRTSEFAVPVDTKNPMMTDPQRFGGAMTFAKRYAFANGFGIMTADEDIDGAGSRPKPPGPSSLHGERAPSHDDIANKRKLADLLRSVHRCQGYNLDEAGKRAIEQWLIDETIISDTQGLSDLSGKTLADAVAKVQAKLHQPKT